MSCKTDRLRLIFFIWYSLLVSVHLQFYLYNIQSQNVKFLKYCNKKKWKSLNYSSDHVCIQCLHIVHAWNLCWWKHVFVLVYSDVIQCEWGEQHYLPFSFCLLCSTNRTKQVIFLAVNLLINLDLQMKLILKQSSLFYRKLFPHNLCIV